MTSSRETPRDYRKYIALATQDVRRVSVAGNVPILLRFSLVRLLSGHWKRRSEKNGKLKKGKKEEGEERQVKGRRRKRENGY